MEEFMQKNFTRKLGDNKNQKYFTKKRRWNTTIKNKQTCQTVNLYQIKQYCQYVIPVYFSDDRKLVILDFHNFVNA